MRADRTLTPAEIDAFGAALDELRVLADHMPAIAEAVGNRRVKGILATHGHSDHIDAAPELSRLVDAPVYLHPTDGFLWQRQNPGAHYRQLLDGATFDIAGTGVAHESSMLAAIDGFLSAPDPTD